jgi:pimeloyl-ACP methyl ester carboxylesterase
MSRIALDGITLAVGEWPGPREADTDKTVICVHGLSANRTCWASVAGVLSPPR